MFTSGSAPGLQTASKQMGLKPEQRSSCIKSASKGPPPRLAGRSLAEAMGQGPRHCPWGPGLSFLLATQASPKSEPPCEG